MRTAHRRGRPRARPEPPIRQGFVKPGSSWSGSIVWSETYSGREIARIGYQAHMGQEDGFARLRYTLTRTWSGEKTLHDYRVELATRSQLL